MPILYFIEIIGFCINKIQIATGMTCHFVMFDGGVTELFMLMPGLVIFRSPDSYPLPHILVNGERIKGLTPTP